MPSRHAEKLLSGTFIADFLLIPFVLPQMTLTADELILHKISAIYDIEMILGRFGPLEVPHAGK